MSLSLFTAAGPTPDYVQGCRPTKTKPAGDKVDFQHSTYPSHREEAGGYTSDNGGDSESDSEDDNDDNTLTSTPALAEAGRVLCRLPGSQAGRQAGRQVGGREERLTRPT